MALIDVTERARAQRRNSAAAFTTRRCCCWNCSTDIKNNLQLVTAMIRLEARSQREGDSVNLEKLAGRIKSLQLLYRDLAADALGQTVDLGHYLSQIASAVMHIYAVGGIRLDLKVDHAPVSINVAMPIGLVVNELLTNALKYAFIGRESGTITLHSLAMSDGCRIVVADDGAAFPRGRMAGAWQARRAHRPVIARKHSGRDRYGRYRAWRGHARDNSLRSQTANPQDKLMPPVQRAATGLSHARTQIAKRTSASHADRPGGGPARRFQVREIVCQRGRQRYGSC